MAYSKEVITRARARLAQEKTDWESQYNQRMAQAYSQLPRLREIDRRLQLTMLTAAQATFTPGADLEGALEKARQENLSLQQERSALLKLHFPEGYLDADSICPHCGGSGYIGSTMCACLRELCRQEQKKELSLLSGEADAFEKFRLEYYSDQYDSKLGTSPRSVMEKTLRACRSYAAAFTPNSGNLLFNGGTGLGKTFLSACIAAAVTDRGYSVMYETAGKLFSKLEQAKFTGNEEARRDAEKYTQCDLLILDDLGTEMPGQFVTAALYSLLTDRLLAGKPLLISTNLSIDELSRRYNPQIASRLRGNFTQFMFLGEDIRVLKNRGY